MLKKPWYKLFIIIFISTSGLAVASQIMSFKVSTAFEALYPILFYINIILALLSVVFLFFSGNLFKTRKMLWFVALIATGFFFFFPLYTLYTNTFRTRRALVCNGQHSIQVIGKSVLSYTSETENFPNSNNWCDIVIEREKGIYPWYFKLGGKQDNSCGFAFNDNLSKLPIDGLEPNTVLIFEADGPWNFTSGPEQFPGSRHRDRYFPRKEKFAYLFFVDGSLVKYRLHDGAVALYEPGKDEFTGYRKKSETPYSPLKWE